MVWLKNSIILLIVLLITAVTAIFSPLLALVFLTLAMIGFVVTQSLVAQRLYDWLQAPHADSVPEASGTWGEMFDQISSFLREEQTARQSLNDEITQIRGTIDRLPDALVLMDEDNVIQWCNDAAHTALGIFSPSRPITQYIRQPEFIRYLNAGVFAEPIEIEVNAKTGRIFEIRVHSTEDGNRVLISRDVTEQSLLNQMRSDFVANVSHEIRTPVTVIGGFAETMLDIDLKPEKQREYLETIVHNSHTMQRIVEDLLTLSSLEAVDTNETHDTIDLHRLFHTLAGEARDLSNGQHNIHSQTIEGIQILGRTTEIESAIRNFLSNAVRYTPSQGCIYLEWALKDDEGWITVRDDGIGIAPEHLPRLSERFYRVDRGRSRATGGTGLGLAIVKRIANRHNGLMHVDSKLGEGSSFSLILPKSRISETTNQTTAADSGVDESSSKLD